MPAWTIKAWPTVLSPREVLFCASFKHVGTQVLDPSAKPGSRAGQTLWVSRTTPAVALAWDWAEVEPFVVVLSDPMAILTNARLDVVQAAQEPEEGGGETVIAANTVVHRLPWQKVVRRHLAGLKGIGEATAPAAPYH